LCAGPRAKGWVDGSHLPPPYPLRPPARPSAPSASPPALACKTWHGRCRSLRGVCVFFGPPPACRRRRPTRRVGEASKVSGATARSTAGAQSVHGVCRAPVRGRKGVAGEGLGKGGGRGAPQRALRTRWRSRAPSPDRGCASTTRGGIAAGSTGRAHSPETPVLWVPAAGKNPRRPRFFFVSEKQYTVRDLALPPARKKKHE